MIQVVLLNCIIEESYSKQVRRWVREAEVMVTCRIALPETISALHRRFREGDFSDEKYQLLKTEFSEDWKNFAAIDFDELEAGNMVEKHSLKGFDAVHLSAVKLLMSVQEGISLSFSTFDEKLKMAATVEGYTIL